MQKVKATILKYDGHSYFGTWDPEWIKGRLGTDLEWVPMAQAQILYALSWDALASPSIENLHNYRVVCHLDDAPYRLLKNPAFQAIAGQVGLWVAHCISDRDEALTLGWNVELLPYVETAFPAKKKVPSADPYVLGHFEQSQLGSFFKETLKKLKQEKAHLRVENSVNSEVTVSFVSDQGSCGRRALYESLMRGIPTRSVKSGMAVEFLSSEEIINSVSEYRKLFTTESNSRTYEVKDVNSAIQKLKSRLQQVSPRGYRKELEARPAGSREKVGGSLSDKAFSAVNWVKNRTHLGPSKENGQIAVSILREFVKPPYGGGNQFMLALKAGLERLGVRVFINEISPVIDGYIFDSLWFQDKYINQLYKLNRPKVVHRIDGPIHLYRGKDKEMDDKIFELNVDLATATVIQSDFTLRKLRETGYNPVAPTIIHNAVNSDYFFRTTRPTPKKGEKIKLISSSWSNNPKKGGPIYRCLEDNLDWNRFEYTFVGRCSEQLKKIKEISPVPSQELGSILREHDIYITASENDPCSNALIEGLSSGLPALGLESGGHPELIGFGGLTYKSPEQALSQLDRLVEDHEAYRNLISVRTIEEVAADYLALITGSALSRLERT